YYIFYLRRFNYLYIFHIISDKKSHHRVSPEKSGQVYDHVRPCLTGFYEQAPRQTLCSEVLPDDNCRQILIIKILCIFTRFSGNT
ncbi:MAG: hypothetical protein B6245_20660, partial [Desulfobacteraceae bacterium 4572_88]